MMCDTFSGATLLNPAKAYRGRQHFATLTPLVREGDLVAFLRHGDEVSTNAWRLQLEQSDGRQAMIPSFGKPARAGTSNLSIWRNKGVLCALT